MKRLFTIALVTFVALSIAAAQPTPNALYTLLGNFPGEAWLYARDLSTGRELAHHADRPFYLNSCTKVLIMAAVYDKMLRRGLTRDHVVSFTEEDYRESRRTLRDRFDETWTLQKLIDPMINVSDTAATDRLVKWVGTEQLNRFVASLGISGIGHITSIGELDRKIMSYVDPGFAKVPYHKLERWNRDGDTSALVPGFFKTDPRTWPEYRARRREAYGKYYATGWNSATPRAMGEVYRRIAEGRLVSPEASAWMRETMGRTSAPRVGREIGPQAWLYSKDGGKFQVTCSAAIVRTGSREMVVGVYTQKSGADEGALVSRAGSLAYDILAPKEAFVPPARPVPAGLSPAYVLPADTAVELWKRYREDFPALLAARARADAHEFAAGATVRAAITFTDPPRDIPMVVIGCGPNRTFIRYQRVFRAGERRSWSPGWPGTPGDWRADFYLDGQRVRTASWHVGEE